MALFSLKTCQKFIYSWLNLISSFSSNYESGRFKLLQILSNLSPILGVFPQTLLMYIGKLFREFEIWESSFLVSFWISHLTHLHDFPWFWRWFFFWWNKMIVLWPLLCFNSNMASRYVLKRKRKTIEDPSREKRIWISVDTEYRVDKKVTFTWN